MDHSETERDKESRVMGFTSLSTHNQTRREGDFDDATPLINRYRQTLASYQKLFPLQVRIKPILVSPVMREPVQESRENQKPQINVEQIRHHYTKQKPSRDQSQPRSSPWKSMTETKAKKKVALGSMIQSLSKGSNLQFEIHKQRFFHTFLKKGAGESGDKLAGIRKKLILQ